MQDDWNPNVAFRNIWQAHRPRTGQWSPQARAPGGERKVERQRAWRTSEATPMRSCTEIPRSSRDSRGSFSGLDEQDLLFLQEADRVAVRRCDVPSMSLVSEDVDGPSRCSSRATTQNMPFLQSHLCVVIGGPRCAGELRAEDPVVVVLPLLLIESSVAGFKVPDPAALWGSSTAGPPLQEWWPPSCGA